MNKFTLLNFIQKFSKQIYKKKNNIFLAKNIAHWYKFFHLFKKNFAIIIAFEIYYILNVNFFLEIYKHNRMVD